MKFAKRIRNIFIAAGVGMLTQAAGGCTSSPEPQKNSSPKVHIRKVGRPVVSLEYRTDTLYHGTSILMYFQNGQGIVRNYLEKNEAFRLQMPYAVHEWWHSVNYKTGYRNRFKFTPYEYFRLCMHDEISANLAALLTVRYEYLAAKDKSEVLKKYQKSQYKFYIEAVKKGEIKPESPDSLERDKEWNLIANGTRDMWMEKFSEHYASNYNYKMVSRYIKRVGLFADSKKNYSYVRRKMYTIGGIDFSAYMDKDIEPVNNLVKIKENITKVSCFKKGCKGMLDFMENNYKVLSKIDIFHQDEAFQHVFIAARLKYMLKGVSAEDLKTHPQIISSCYEHILSSMQKDKSCGEFLKKCGTIDNNCAIVIANTGNEYAENIRRMYTFNGVDLSEQIKNFDVHNVPYPEDSFVPKYTDLSNICYFAPFDMGEEAMCSDEIKPLIKSAEQSEKQSKTVIGILKPAEVKKRRLSGKQSLSIPNFCEPILTGATVRQNEEILAMMRDFEMIPAVLKGCNTKAINEYKKMNGRENGR